MQSKVSNLWMVGCSRFEIDSNPNGATCAFVVRVDIHCMLPCSARTYEGDFWVTDPESQSMNTVFPWIRQGSESVHTRQPSLDASGINHFSSWYRSDFMYRRFPLISWTDIWGEYTCIYLQMISGEVTREEAEKPLKSSPLRDSNSRPRRRQIRG